MSNLSITILSNLIAIREGLYAKRSRMVNNKSPDDQILAINRHIDDIIKEIYEQQEVIEIEKADATLRREMGLPE